MPAQSNQSGVLEPSCITCISSFAQPVGNGKLRGKGKAHVVYGGFYLKQLLGFLHLSMLPRITYLYPQNSSHVNEGIIQNTQRAVNPPLHPYFLSIYSEEWGYGEEPYLLYQNILFLLLATFFF